MMVEQINEEFLTPAEVAQLPLGKSDRGAVIDFRHLIGHLVRKPGAFANYRWREELFPAPLPDPVRDETKRLARVAYEALKLGGCARIDFRLHPDGGLYCLEANTLPGMTGTSLVPQAAQADGVGFPELCERIARAALDD